MVMLRVRKNRVSLIWKRGYQLKPGHFPLFGGFASLNPPYTVTLAAKKESRVLQWFSCYLNPASVEFTEDLPAAGRCKAARAQTYYDTSSPCQHRRFGKIGAP